MSYCDYLGHESQISGIEEHRLVGGKGDGLRLLEVRNGNGLECTISADRCADISRLTFMGRNMGYFSPCGYAAPAYYEREGMNWLKTFTAGFLTTCGLTSLGGPSEDEGEVLPMHGTIGNTPAEHIWWYRQNEELVVEADIKDAQIFGRKLLLHRKIIFSTTENKMTLTDVVENQGDETSPLMVLYHMNMGYPLLSENAEVVIPSAKVIPRSENAARDIDTHLEMLKPTAGYEEQCFFHEFEDEGKAKIYNPDIGLGLVISFDTKFVNSFCEWKMMGKHDYVLGLEPGNNTPGPRSVRREAGTLQYLEPGESKELGFTVKFYDDKTQWDNA